MKDIIFSLTGQRSLQGRDNWHAEGNRVCRSVGEDLRTVRGCRQQY